MDWLLFFILVSMTAMDSFDALSHLVGKTPLLEVRCRFRDVEHKIYAKHETCNFTGSIKDRMAFHILKEAYQSGEIQPGDEIAEATSGNTGIAFAGLGRALGHPVRIYMPDWMSQERVHIIQSLGASVIPISKEEGGFLGSIARANEYAAATPGVFRPRQFENEANVHAHYKSTGPELLAQLASVGQIPRAFVSGVGTGGTVMGVGKYLKEELGDTAVAIHPLEPANSPTLRTGTKVGKHRIQGISDEFIPAILDLDWLDSIVDVWDGDSIIMAQRLSRELGLGLGISSGANFLGALDRAAEIGEEAVVATVFADCHKKYLSTDYCSDEEAKDHYLSSEVELIDFRVIT